MNELKISIITAIHNNVSMISGCIDSISKQKFDNVEVIVVDGGSNDGTLELIQKYRDKITTVISEPDNGIYDALNKGVSLATGDIIGFMHSDDLFYDEDSLGLVAKAFNDYDVDAVYGDLIYVDRENTDRLIRYWKSGGYHPDKLAKGWMPPHPTFYMKRSLYEKYGGFDLQYRIAADYDAMLRYLTLGKTNVHYIPEVLVRMRVGGASNRSLRNMLLKSQEDYRALKHHNIGGLNTLLMKNLSKIPQFFTR